MTSLVQMKTLAEAPERFLEVVKLIEKSFGYDKKHSYVVDFYPLMEKSNWPHCHFLLKENQVIGHIGYKSYQLTQDLGKACFLGGIAVDENQRGHGYFKFLFENTFKNYSQHQAFFLWSNLHEFYRNFGFEPAFSYYELQKSGAQKEFIQKNISAITDQEWSEIKKLYEIKSNQHLSVKRTEQHWNHLKEITSAKWFLARKKNQLLGYAVLDKGMDLSGIVHEFALKDASLFPYLRTLGKVWISNSELKNFKIPASEARFQIACLAKSHPKEMSFFISGLDSI